MSGPDFWMQQQLEQERVEILMEILERVSHGTSTEQDATNLASELGLTNLYTNRR